MRHGEDAAPLPQHVRRIRAHEAMVMEEQRRHEEAEIGAPASPPAGSDASRVR